MIRHSAAIACLLAGSVLASAAMAQQTGLTFVEPLSADAVREVQSKLNAVGGFAGPVNGTWSATNESNLQAFQQSHGLQATGQLNQATATMLGLTAATLVSSVAPAPPAPAAAALPAPPVTFTLSADSMRIIQARLSELGYYTGAIDAQWGSGTISALENFQSAKGLPADGRLTKATVLALGLDPSTIQAQR